MRNMIINSKPAAVLKNCQFHAPFISKAYNRIVLII